MRRPLTCLCVVVSAVVMLFPPAAWAQAPGAAAAKSQEAASQKPTAKLPIRRVVLYKNGVGYFEHLGRVRGNQEVTVDFTSAQLNDVLQSLTILDLSGGRITGVGYNSEAPLARRLGALRLPLGEKLTVAEFLGARLEVRSGTSTITGRLLTVERKTRISGGTTLEVDYLTIVSDGGEVRGIELSPAVAVRLAERDLHQEVGRYLALLASTREQDLRRMVISTAGTGERPLYVSYISEVPVWKTTYRLVLPAKPGTKPLLQGWAIVDNTVGEDWNDVELSLVAGAPQSFIQPLSQPYYARRPVIPLAESAQLTPQTHQATLIGGYGRLSGKVTDPLSGVVPGAQVRVYSDAGSLLGTTATDNEGLYQFDSLPAGNYRVEIESPGFRRTVVQNVLVTRGGRSEQNVALQLGAVTETVTVQAAPAGPVDTSSASLSGAPRALGTGRQLGSGGGIGTGAGGGAFTSGAVVGGVPGGQAGGVVGGTLGQLTLDDARARVAAAAQAQELGDLFEYKLKERVTIRKNQSALVPILHTEIAAEKVSLWHPSSGSARPLRALWVTNSSPLTLDGGSFSVLEDESFAGEGLLDPIKPGEKRLLSYAVDLGVLVDTRQDSDTQRVTRVRIARGVMTHISEQRERKTYTVRNEDTAPRALVIEHPVRPEWKFASGGPQPEETSAGFHRFRLNVEPKKTATLTINEVRPTQALYELSNVTDDQIALFLRQRTINPEIEQALRRILEQKNRVATLEMEAAKREEEMNRIYDDQQRLRENLKALKGSAEEKALTERYIRQLAEQETRLETLRRENTELETRREKAQADLDAMSQQVALEVTL